MTDRWGIDEEFIDALGRKRAVNPHSLERLREIIGDTTARDTAPIVVRDGQTLEVGPGAVHLEDGEVRVVADFLPRLPFGYHTFVDQSGDPRPLISSPGRCYVPDTRRWGWAIQLYATRSAQSWGIGDLADLRRLAHWSESLGADFLLINPIGAVSPVGNPQPSPYFPASRRFRNPIFVCVEEVPGAEHADADIAAAGAAGRELNRGRTIDRAQVWQLKRRALEAIWRSGPPPEAFERWHGRQPQSLHRFATWSALADEYGSSWRRWPENCRRSDGSGVPSPSSEEARFHAWLQWLLEIQLDHASHGAALIQDLPIGVDPQGFDAWEWQDLLALDVSVGAPPDEFIPEGQDWGLPPFVPSLLAAAGYEPFIDTIRAALFAAGGLRIDHVMGLFRLWWIPAGASPSEGAYVRYPADDLLAIVALESHRTCSSVVGEDLGTVEAEAQQALAAHALLSYRLLWFEQAPPSQWPLQAMGAVTTHDLPTVAGLWDGSDLQSQRALGIQSNEEATVAIRTHLAETGGLDDDADPSHAVWAAYGQLAQAPCIQIAASLDDALVVAERPNMPGTGTSRPNWSLALPATIETLEVDAEVLRIAALLTSATRSPHEVEPNEDPRGTSTVV